MNELVGTVSKGFVTRDMVKVKLVAPLTIESRISLIDVVEVMEHREDTPEVVKEHTEPVVSRTVYVGNVITTNDPEISLFIVTNHKSYVVTLPILGNCGFTPLNKMLDAEEVICKVV